eukprot:CAMPEP_0196657932 /NCGR_PEP_ID=MMETSP1086-20130531/26410_1 /TAXON_ID=77921 /ORGANISM="Cyanoptyche  gloeocystis , Strain SAG4.97" /LENGTH=103 /DNA_ID=CAMNT_0041991257 /DNA_START=309 /DNA_END=620 /DNA_ORIENTATION=+
MSVAVQTDEELYAFAMGRKRKLRGNRASRFLPFDLLFNNQLAPMIGAKDGNAMFSDIVLQKYIPFRKSRQDDFRATMNPESHKAVLVSHKLEPRHISGFSISI